MDEVLAQWTESELADLAIVMLALLLPLVLFVKWRRRGGDPISERGRGAGRLWRWQGPDLLQESDRLAEVNNVDP